MARVERAVTDALAARRNVNARVEDAETLIVALAERCDQLLLTGKALSARVAQLEDRCQALSDELALLNRSQFAVFQSFTVFKSLPFLQRLRWIARG